MSRYPQCARNSPLSGSEEAPPAAMSNDSTLSFDRMRGMLMRAAEIRDSEQQQIFDSLDEIHARLAALDALGTIRKRMTELPDRTEVSVLAERLDETVAKLDAQDAAIAAVMRAVEALPDKIAKPIAQLDGRLDGMAGRLEGVSGRMDGLDDRLLGLHKRLDDLDNRLDRHEMRLDAMPSSVGTPIKERIDGIERTVREQLDNAVRAMDESDEGMRNLLGDTSIGLHRRLEDLAARPAVDPTEPLDGLATRLGSLAERLDAVSTRLDSLEEGLSGRLGSLGGEIDQKLGKLDAALVARPDAHSVRTLVEQANEESERRNAGQLDEAMATFAELILGRGAAVQSPPPPPRPAQRRTSRKVVVKSPNGASVGDIVNDDPDD
jgi:tetrahydromethanopterin S-methyltransferase subunit G